jgi:hypothetical protein
MPSLSLPTLCGMIDALQKTDALFEFADTLRYDRRIAFSNEGNLWSIENIYHPDQYKDEFKPRGLWYSFGKSWITHLKKELNARYLHDDGTSTITKWGETKLRETTHIYQIYLDEDKLMKIHSKEDLNLFEKKHRPVRRHKQVDYGYGNGANWLNISKKYSGIEIKHPYYLKSRIFYGWDCSSGCIWNRKAVKSIKLLKSWTPYFK